MERMDGKRRAVEGDSGKKERLCRGRMGRGAVEGVEEKGGHAVERIDGKMERLCRGRMGRGRQ